MLTMFVFPYENELLSSWIYRLTSVNQLNWVQFLREFTPFKTNSQTDIDRYLSIESIEELSRITPVKIQTILDMKLSFFSNKIFKNEQVGPNKWILIRGQISKNHPTKMQTYCMTCRLSYFRRDHRISIVCICEKCNHYLSDSCEHCNMSIVFLKNQRYNQIIDYSITQCFNCHRQIFSNSTVNEKPNKALIDFQTKLIYLMYTDYSLLYFDKLHKQATKLLRGNIHHKSVRGLQLLSPKKRILLLYKANLILESS